MWHLAYNHLEVIFIFYIDWTQDINITALLK